MARKHNKQPGQERASRLAAVSVPPPEILTDKEAIQRLKASLLAAVEKQAADAEEKQRNAWYWGETGNAEQSAVWDAQSMINAVSTDTTLENYRGQIVGLFLHCIDYFRSNDETDPDGYALGTLYEILRDTKLSWE
jgi:hypothetical protein